MHLNHVDGTINLLSDSLSREPRLDDIEACECNNKNPCAKFCCAMDNEMPSSQPPFSLDLINIANEQISYSYCAPIISTINNHKCFNYENVSVNKNAQALRTFDNKVVVHLHDQSRIM